MLSPIQPRANLCRRVPGGGRDADISGAADSSARGRRGGSSGEDEVADKLDHHSTTARMVGETV